MLTAKQCSTAQTAGFKDAGIGEYEYLTSHDDNSGETSFSCGEFFLATMDTFFFSYHHLYDKWELQKNLRWRKTTVYTTKTYSFRLHWYSGTSALATVKLAETHDVIL